MSYRKKLIEVALPLDAINEACKPETENPFLRNHPRALHVWWARTPLVACRAVIFASVVDDPSSHPEEFPTEEAQTRERQRLFRLLEALASWESTSDRRVLSMARREMLNATGGEELALLDPFCGRGSIPLEGQRLGLTPYASDLNPVAVLITKMLVQVPHAVRDREPVSGTSATLDGDWSGLAGLSQDLKHYSAWLSVQASERLQPLYPPLPTEGVGPAVIA